MKLQVLFIHRHIIHVDAESCDDIVAHTKTRIKNSAQLVEISSK